MRHVITTRRNSETIHVIEKVREDIVFYCCGQMTRYPRYITEHEARQLVKRGLMHHCKLCWELY
jgi:hypothetical protein